MQISRVWVYAIGVIVLVMLVSGTVCMVASNNRLSRIIPAVPDNLSADPSATSIKLNWTEPSKNAKHFLILRDGSVVQPVSLVATVPLRTRT